MAAAAGVVPYINFRDTVLSTSSTEDCVARLRREGLLEVQQYGPHCGLNVVMLVQHRLSNTDAWQWRCPNACCRMTCIVQISGTFSKLPKIFQHLCANGGDGGRNRA